MVSTRVEDIFSLISDNYFIEKVTLQQIPAFKELGVSGDDILKILLDSNRITFEGYESVTGQQFEFYRPTDVPWSVGEILALHDWMVTEHGYTAQIPINDLQLELANHRRDMQAGEGADFWNLVDVMKETGIAGRMKAAPRDTVTPVVMLTPLDVYQAIEQLVVGQGLDYFTSAQVLQELTGTQNAIMPTMLGVHIERSLKQEPSGNNQRTPFGDFESRPFQSQDGSLYCRVKCLRQVIAEFEDRGYRFQEDIRTSPWRNAAPPDFSEPQPGDRSR